MNTYIKLFDAGWWSSCFRASFWEILILISVAVLIGWFLNRGKGVRQKIETEWKNRLKKLETELNHTQKNNKKLKAEIEDNARRWNTSQAALAENEKLKTQLAQLQQQFETLDKEHTMLKSAYQKEKQSLSEASRLSGELELQKNRITNLTAELEEWKQKAAALKESLDAAIAEKVKLASSLQINETEALRQKIVRLENDLNSSRLLVSRYQTESKKMEEMKAALENERKQLATQKAEWEALQQKLQKTENELQKARQLAADRDQLKNELDALKKEFEGLKEESARIPQLVSELNLWKEKAAAIENDLDNSYEEIKQLKTEKEEVLKMKAALEQLEQENHLLKAQSDHINTKDAEIASLKIKIAELQDELERLRITQATASVSYQERKWEEAESEKQQHRQSVEQLQKETFQKEATENTSIPNTLFSTNPDDLKMIEGIGPKIEKLLNDAGINTFKQLSETHADRLKEILENAGERYSVHDTTTWPEQARLLAEGKTEEFKQLTEKLKGGRIQE